MGKNLSSQWIAKGKGYLPRQGWPTTEGGGPCFTLNGPPNRVGRAATINFNFLQGCETHKFRLPPEKAVGDLIPWHTYIKHLVKELTELNTRPNAKLLD